MRSDRDFRQKKSLGQVFLKTDWPVTRLVDKLKSWQVRRVVEIGPGPGILTRQLGEAEIVTTAIEKDYQLVERLNQDVAAGVLLRTTIIHGDALKFDYGAWLAESSDPAAIVGNIPYNISSPLIQKVMPYVDQTRGVLFMTQLEFAKRLGGRPGTKDYGSLSVFVQLRSRPTLEYVVPKNCFRPVPKVDSAVVSLMPLVVQTGFSESDLAKAEEVTKAAFSQRRKKLLNGVRKLMGDKTPQSSPIDLNRRAETLTPEEFMQLTMWLRS